ncbi:MAG: signal peptidase I [Clostridia bacterium]|nr:signal peptidase I [Clostridia bacterium]
MEPRRRTGFKVVYAFISAFITCVVVLLAILLVGVRLVGLQPFAVLSGSMEPEYPTGSLIYVRECAAADVQVGDPITFVLNEDLVIATHRVIAIDAENQHFYTKGDANDSADGAPVHFNNLIGVPVMFVPYMGYVADFVTNPPGLYITICVGVLLLLWVFVPDIVKKLDAKEKAAQTVGEQAAQEASAADAAEPAEDDISPKG